MPTVDVIFDDLQRLIGIKLPKEKEELDDILSYVKGEVESVEEDTVKIEVKDGNRPDLWNIEGIARELRGALGIEEGIKKYKITASSGVKINVNSKLHKIRPYIASSVVKGVKLNDEVIRGLMNLQEKLDQTYGRRRRKTSIGLYNYDLITPPLSYTAVKPGEISFVPLDFVDKMTLKEILEKHPKGIEYGHIVRAYKLWPILIDSNRKVLSFPPIINSNDLGRITINTENVLVEVTGTAFETVLNTLTIVTLSLADRGGEIYSVEINYPYKEKGKVITPCLANSMISLSTDYANMVLGFSLKTDEIMKFLKRARFGIVGVDNGTVIVEVPCYRLDIMHPIDVVEDIAIMYGFNLIQPKWPELITVGELSRKEKFYDLIRELMVGLGFQEILSFSMSNHETLFDKMNLKRKRVIEVSNPRVSTFTCLRNWLIPSLMEFLRNNTHVEYPQRVFEVGTCVVFNKKRENRTLDVKKLACLTIHANANFSEARAVLDALLRNVGVAYKIVETKNGSFIEGRVGKIITAREKLGIIGEINPIVLENWNLKNPAAGFEINLDELFQEAIP